MMIKRIYYHYIELEEFQNGMWRIVRGELRRINATKAAALMRDIDAFTHAMRCALTEWPKSCAHNLSAEDTNRLAWLGHAGNCLALNSPEENTRIGWHMLTSDEQEAANAAAQKVLDEWIKLQHVSRQLCLFEDITC